MTTKVKFVALTGAEYTASIKKLAASIDKVSNVIQVLAVNAIRFSIVDRNTTPATQLYVATAKGMRRDAIVRFLEQNGNLRWSKEKSAFEFMELRKTAEWTDDLAVQLLGTSWQSAKAEKAPESLYDVEAAVEKFLQQIDARIAAKKPVEHADLAARLKQTVAQYHAEAYSAAADGK